MADKPQAKDKRLEALESLLNVASTKANIAEFVEAFKSVVGIFSKMRTEFDEWRKDGDTWLANTSKFLEKRIGEIKNGKDGRDGKDGVDGRDGIDGLDGKDGLAGENGKDGSPDMAEDIRNKLELLEGDERLHFSKIGGLDDWEEVQKSVRERKNVTFINGHGSLWGLEDVNVIGLTVGQALKWDGVQWIPYTPASSSGVSVIAVTGTVDDSNETFTATSQPTLLNINGTFYQQTGGAITWTYSGGTITLSSPVGIGGQIFGI